VKTFNYLVLLNFSVQSLTNLTQKIKKLTDEVTRQTVNVTKQMRKAPCRCRKGTLSQKQKKVRLDYPHVNQNILLSTLKVIEDNHYVFKNFKGLNIFIKRWKNARFHLQWQRCVFAS
jgi:hypothetical protein